MSQQSPAAPHLRAPTWVDTSLLFSLGAIWGSVFLCIEIGLEVMGPYTLTASRLLLSSLLLLGLMMISGLSFPTEWRDWRQLLLVGFFNAALPFSLISWGQQSVDSSIAPVLMGAGPLLGLVLNHFFTSDDRLSLTKIIGVALGFCGVLLLFGEQALMALQSGWNGSGADAQAAGLLSSPWATLLGQIAIVGAAASYALSGLLTRRLSHLDTRVASAVMLLLSTLYILPLAYWKEGMLIDGLSLESGAAILFMGIFATGLAALMRFKIIKNTGAVFMGQVSYLVPFFGVFFSAVFFLRLPENQTLIALAFILCGVAVSRIRRRD